MHKQLEKRKDAIIEQEIQEEKRKEKEIESIKSKAAELEGNLLSAVRIQTYDNHHCHYLSAQILMSCIALPGRGQEQSAGAGGGGGGGRAETSTKTTGLQALRG